MVSVGRKKCSRKRVISVGREAELSSNVQEKGCPIRGLECLVGPHGDSMEI